MEKIKILLVDDTAAIRAELRRMLDQQRDMVVVAEAGNVSEAMISLDREQPTLVVTDLSMGRDNGLDLVVAVRQRLPQVGALVLSTDVSEALVAEAIKRGASGYVLKEEAAAELAIAIRAVVAGEVYMSATVSKKMIKWFAHTRNSDLQVRRS